MVTADDVLTVTIRALTARAQILREATSNVAQETYEVIWTVEDGARELGLSGDVWDFRSGRLGVDGLQDVMLEVAREAAAAADFSFPSDPPGWYVQAQAVRQARHRGVRR